MKPAKLQPDQMTAVELADWASLSYDRVRKLSLEGWFPKASRGIYPRKAATQGVLAYERSRLDGAAAARIEKIMKETELKDSQLRLNEIEIARSKKELVPLKDAVKRIDEALAVVAGKIHFAMTEQFPQLGAGKSALELRALGERLHRESVCEPIQLWAKDKTI